MVTPRRTFLIWILTPTQKLLRAADFAPLAFVSYGACRTSIQPARATSPARRPTPRRANATNQALRRVMNEGRRARRARSDLESAPPSDPGSWLKGGQPDAPKTGSMSARPQILPSRLDGDGGIAGRRIQDTSSRAGDGAAGQQGWCVVQVEDERTSELCAGGACAVTACALTYVVYVRTTSKIRVSAPMPDLPPEGLMISADAIVHGRQHGERTDTATYICTSGKTPIKLKKNKTNISAQ